jgi:hypothetical protein
VEKPAERNAGLISGAKAEGAVQGWLGRFQTRCSGVAGGHQGYREVMPPARGLLPWPHVQFWEAENRRGLDRPHRWGHCRNIPCVVDASDVCTLRALNDAWAR